MSFVCRNWQWPILIKCVKCYCLCVLRWLMRQILALNCLLQTEQERSEEECSVGDALALACRCARFCSASLIVFASYSPVPLLMRPRHFARSCAICFHDSVGMLKFLREAFGVSLYRFFWQRRDLIFFFFFFFFFCFFFHLALGRFYSNQTAR